jgi:hypothetical protein
VMTPILEEDRRRQTNLIGAFFATFFICIFAYVRFTGVDMGIHKLSIIGSLSLAMIVAALVRWYKLRLGTTL